MYRSVFIWLMVDQRITSMKRMNIFLIVNQSELNDTVACAYLYIFAFLRSFLCFNSRGFHINEV